MRRHRGEEAVMAELHPDIERVVFSEEDIAAIVEKMGREITEEYADKNPLVVCVLAGQISGRTADG